MPILRIYMPDYVATYLRSVYGVEQVAPDDERSAIRFPQQSRFFQIINNSLLPPADLRSYIAATQRDTKNRRLRVELINAHHIGEGKLFPKGNTGYVDAITPPFLTRYGYSLAVSDDWMMPKSINEAFVVEAKQMFWTDLMADIADSERQGRAQQIHSKLDAGVLYFMSRHQISTDHFEAILRAYHRRVKRQREEMPPPAGVRANLRR